MLFIREKNRLAFESQKKTVRSQHQCVAGVVPLCAAKQIIIMNRSLELQEFDAIALLGKVKFTHE